MQMQSDKGDDEAEGAASMPLSAACGVPLCATIVGTWLLNASVFPTTAAVFPLAREIQTLAGIAAAVGFLALSMRRPTTLRPRRMAAMSIALMLIGSAILLMPSKTSPVGVSLGLTAFAFGSAWVSYPIGIGLSLMGITRKMCATVAISSLTGVLISVAFPAPAYSAGVIARAIITIAAILLPLGLTEKSILSITSQPGGAEMQLSSPQSFLPAGHQLYVMMFVFSTAFGFALSYRISENAPLTSSLQLAIIAVVAIWLISSRDPVERADDLFAVAATLVVSGFVSTLVHMTSTTPVPNGMLYAGSRCFSILSWVVLASLCQRSPSGAITFLALGDAMTSAGTFVGADLGHLVNLLAGIGPDIGPVVTGALVIALFAYVVFGMREFAFSGTIKGVVPYVKVEVDGSAEPSHEEAFQQACNQVAKEHGLTEREAEVMGLLARGHNGHHIEEALTLSYNTVKTHVKRIYRKLDVHSQQELIDMVDECVGEGTGTRAGAESPAVRST